MTKSITAQAARKGRPNKPRASFPLFPHRCGRWAKKVLGKFEYFTKWTDDPKGEAALAQWLDQRDDLLAGRVPRARTDALTVKDLANHFLNAKRHRVVSGELTARSFDDYLRTGERLIKTFGAARPVDDLQPHDFDELRASIAKQWGPVRLGGEIQRVRTIFKFGFEAGHIERPVRFGPLFKRPSQKVLRLTRAEKGPRMFEAAQIRALIAAAGTQLRAMILLGINAGFGNADVATLPITALDLAGGWINYPRPKTGVARRVPLWPETVAALKAAIAARPTPKDAADVGLVFITKYGGSWAKATRDNPVSKELAKLLLELKMKRPGLGFYALRHSFETIGGESKDQVAVDSIMGHARYDMPSLYRERVSDERLTALTEFVRKWLFEDAARLD